mmetsp:Transcript_106967/g.190196  ORF Transcript_106967/g.190196 Transcript_106967/m.190196 type:complete len:131 (+) Transcript_106967:678-1070(+)
MGCSRCAQHPRQRPNHSKRSSLSSPPQLRGNPDLAAEEDRKSPEAVCEGVKEKQEVGPSGQEAKTTGRAACDQKTSHRSSKAERCICAISLRKARLKLEDKDGRETVESQRSARETAHEVPTLPAVIQIA